MALPLLPRWLRWTGVGAVAGVILLASVVDPGPGVPAWGPFGVVRADKWTHFLAYAGLAGAVAYALAHRGSDRQVVAVAFLVAAAYGGGIELLQSGIPSRTFDPADALVNALGAAVAVLVWRVLSRRVPFRPVFGADPGAAATVDPVAIPGADVEDDGGPADR